MVGTCDVNNVKYLSPTQGKHSYTPKDFILTHLAKEKVLSAMIPHFMRANCLQWSFLQISHISLVVGP